MADSRDYPEELEGTLGEHDALSGEEEGQHSLASDLKKQSRTHFEGASSMLDAELTSPSPESPPAEDDGKPLYLQLEELEREFGPNATCQDDWAPTAADSESDEPTSEPQAPGGPWELAQVHFNNQDFDACMVVLNQLLKDDPGHAEAPDLLRTTQVKWEEQRLERELANHIASIKQEAIEQFEKGQYRECLSKFKFLSEAAPDDRDLKDFLEVTQEQIQNLGESQPTAPPSESPGSAEPPADPDPPFPEALPPSHVPVAEIPPLHLEQPFPGLETGDIPTLPQAGWGEEPSPGSPPRPRQADPETGGLGEPFTRLRSKFLESLSKEKLLVIGLIGGALLIGAILGVWLVSGSSEALTAVDFGSDPFGANVYLDGKLRGQTPLHLESVPVGSHSLRLEKNGYALLLEKMEARKGEPQQLFFRLQKLEVPNQGHSDLRARAKDLLDQGELLGAAGVCEEILESDPLDETALNLKLEIRNRFFLVGNRAMLQKKWQEARDAWNSVLQVSPNDSEALRQLRFLKARKSRRPVVPVKSGRSSTEKEIQALHRKISRALAAENYFPPNPGNVLDLAGQLKNLSPRDTKGQQALEQVKQRLVRKAQARLDSKDTPGAKALLGQLRVFFPDAVEARNLSEILSATESQRVSRKSSWIRRARQAAASEHFVTPANDNAVAYANRALSLDPQDQEALALKSQSIKQAAQRAESWIGQGIFEKARDLYSALYFLSQNESQFPLSAESLKTQVQKLEFHGYPVIHDHTLGSCTGRLRVNGYVVVFLPSGDDKHEFTAKLSDIVNVEPGDKLKVELGNRTYRFQANATRGKEDNRRKIQAMYQQMIRWMKSR